MSDRDEKLETLTALHLGALEPSEAARVRMLVANDADWRALDEQARRMLGILLATAESTAPPAGLARRTAAALVEPVRAPLLTPRLAAAILAVAAAPVLWLLAQWLLAGPPRASIVWNPPEIVASGGRFGPRVLVRDTEDGTPLEGMTIRALLKSANGEEILLGEGETDRSGVLASGGFRLPDLPAGDARLAIEVEDGPRVEAPVRVTAEARLVASPDRQRVRPGESLRVRALLVTTEGAKPLAGREVEISLTDPRGNRVCFERRTTSRFGLAWATFPIDDEAPEGDWRVEARADGQAHVATVAVRRDVLPSYRVVVKPDRRSAKFGEPFRVDIVARTFDDENVRNLSAEVRIGGAGGRRVALPDGAASVDLTAPDHGGPLRIDVKVGDEAGREGAGTATVMVAADAARVLVLPEAGDLVPNVSNRVYLVVRRADGAPPGNSRIEAQRKGQPIPLTTDAQGVAVLTIDDPRVPAEVVTVRAVVDGTPTAWVDRAIHVRSLTAPEPPHASFGSLLLRTDRALVEAGGTIETSVFSSQRTGAVALSLELDGRSVAVAGTELRSGEGRAKLTVPSGIQGLLVVRAAMPVEGAIWSDRRVVLVRGSRDLRVQVAADRDRYRPGETATLACVVTDGDGRGVPAALSIVAVDEALLALTGDRGGLVQAWHEEAWRVLARPDADLDPLVLDDGSAAIAHATAAALRPPTAEDAIDQVGEVLSLAKMREIGPHLARLFGGSNLSPIDRRRRDLVLEDLREDGHAATADALLRLASTGLRGWQDTGPDQRTAAEVAREANGKRLRVAAALLAVLAVAALLLRSGLVVERTLGSLTLLWVTAGLALIPIAGGRDGFAPWVVLQAIILAAQLRAAFATPRYDRGIGIALVCVQHLILGLALSSAEPGLAILGVPVLLIFGAVQAGGRSSLGCVLGGLAATMVFAGMVVVLIPRSQSRSVYLEAMNEARMFAHLVERPGINPTPTTAATPEESRSEAPPPRLRVDFRETLLFAPEVVTGEDGRATVEVPLSDSLTGWRVLADAIAAAGGVAEGRTRLRVSLPLSADLRLPPGGVVAGDEMEVRVVVSNHTSETARVSVDLEAKGAERLDAGARPVEVAPHAVAPIGFRVRFAAPGTATLRVTAGDADRVERKVVVHRDARRVEFGETRRVTGEARFDVRRPSGLLRDGLRGEVSVQRGLLAPVLDGLDAMLQEPHGCFEQTSSIHYPNVLVLRQLERQPGADPRAVERARDLVARGYQRLLGFEVERSGLFSLYGRPPGSPWLTAYGLLQFRAMEGVHPVDPNLLRRVEDALLRHRPTDAAGREGVIDIAQAAYVVLALGDRAPAETCSWLLDRRERIESDPYLCALVSHALQRREPAAAAQLASRLGALAARDGERSFLSAETTLAWGGSRTGGISVEATALGALAIVESGADADLAQGFLDAVVAARLPRGDWGSTHATAWAMKAIEQAVRASGQPAPRAVIEIGGRAFDLGGDEGKSAFDFDPDRAETTVRAQVAGTALVTLRGRGFLAWDSEVPAERGPNASVEWDRRDLALGETALATIRVVGGPTGAKVPMVVWGLFAGAEPVVADLDALREAGRIERFERSGNEVRLYLPDVEAGKTAELRLRLRATARGSFTATPSRVWEYYRPEAVTTPRPVRFTVR